MILSYSGSAFPLWVSLGIPEFSLGLMFWSDAGTNVSLYRCHGYGLNAFARCSGAITALGVGSSVDREKSSPRTTRTSRRP